MMSVVQVMGADSALMDSIEGSDSWGVTLISETHTLRPTVIFPFEVFGRNAGSEGAIPQFFDWPFFPIDAESPEAKLEYVIRHELAHMVEAFAFSSSLSNGIGVEIVSPKVRRAALGQAVGFGRLTAERLAKLEVIAEALGRDTDFDSDFYKVAVAVSTQAAWHDGADPIGIRERNVDAIGRWLTTDQSPDLTVVLVADIYEHLRVDAERISMRRGMFLEHVRAMSVGKDNFDLDQYREMDQRLVKRGDLPPLRQAAPTEPEILPSPSPSVAGAHITKPLDIDLI